MLLENLLVGAGIVVLTILIHFFGLSLLISVMRSVFARGFHERSVMHGGLTIVGVVCSLAVLHTTEIWAFALLYQYLGLFESFMDSLYFSASTFSTLGFGDVLIGEKWRLLAAIEGAHGFLLIGWSTAFLVSVTARMGLLEAQLERAGRENTHSDREPS